jgi:pimeloyl-ACP methyl ester carboxylesterase
MPVVQANGIDVYYETQGEGEPVVLIPYLAADQACYAFQVAEYAKHFTCVTVDLRGAGRSGKPEGAYTTELLADDVVAFMQVAGLDRPMSPASPWARQQACGWRPSIRNV